MTQLDKLVVSQEAREAAADLIEAYWSGADAAMMKLAASYRAGHSQGVFVRAFQRAMNQAADERQEMCAKVAEAPFDGAISPSQKQIKFRKKIADAIRSIGKVADE